MFFSVGCGLVFYEHERLLYPGGPAIREKVIEVTPEEEPKIPMSNGNVNPIGSQTRYSYWYLQDGKHILHPPTTELDNTMFDIGPVYRKQSHASRAEPSQVIDTSEAMP